MNLSRTALRFTRALPIVAALALILGMGIPLFAGTVSGTIRNGTNGKAAAGADVILIELQGGMQPVANTKSDADGHYKIDNPGVGGQAPMLIRAVYHGVMFHQPLPPGQSTADVTVYEPTTDASTVKVEARLIVFQPNGTTLLVNEEYSLENQSKPPVAYFNEQGNFDFALPEGAQLTQVSSWGPSGMPVVQGPISRGGQRYSIAYAFQPGDNGVRFSYEEPYGSNTAKLRFTMDHAADRVALIAPPTVTVTSAGFTPAGTEQGFNVYSRDGMPVGTPFDVAVSGTAPPPSDADQGGDAGQGSDSTGQDQANGHQDSATIQTLPNRLDSLKWILVGGFAALFALGIVFVWRRPVAMVATAGGAAAAIPPPATPGPRKGPRTPAPTPAPLVEVAAAAPEVSTEIRQEVQTSLDALKDKLFRLELRRQAGTIPEEEYARERARTEAVLRELVRG